MKSEYNNIEEVNNGKKKIDGNQQNGDLSVR